MNIQATFQSGYDFFIKSTGVAIGAVGGADYVGTIEKEIHKLNEDMTHFEGFHTDSAMLKGYA